MYEYTVGPPKAPGSAEEYANHKATPCAVCSGTGKIWVENDDGSPSGSHVCPVCDGRGNCLYIRERIDRHFDMWRIPRWFFLLAMFSLWLFDRMNPQRVDYPNTLSSWLLVLWIVLIVGWFVTWLHKKPVPRQTRHAPGFTDDREKTALGLFGAAVAARAFWDAHSEKNK